MGKRHHDVGTEFEGKTPNRTAIVRFSDGQPAATSRPELVRYADGKMVPGSPTPEQVRHEMDATEKGVRIGFSLLHGIGGAAATAFGAGALVSPIGQFEQQGLDALFNDSNAKKQEQST